MAESNSKALPFRARKTKARKALNCEQAKLDLIGIRAAVTCATVHLQGHQGVDAQFAAMLHRAALAPLDQLIAACESGGAS